MSTAKQPNIIYVFSDQQRWDTVGAYGQPLEVTPNLDRMAEEGVRFENAFTCQPVCGPARACIQTGKYATETGCFRNGIALPQDEKTMAHHLAGAGYEVGYIGKWHLASDSNDTAGDYRTVAVPPERRGGYKDYWLAADVLEFTSHGYDGYMFDGNMNKVDFKGYRVDCQTDFVLDYLRTRTLEKPFFLFLSYIEPHHQNDHNRYEGPTGSRERFAQFVPPGDLAGQAGDWRENYADYLGCCASLDENLGRILAELENRGIADNTLIIYTSDHGSHFRTRNNEYKRACQDGCIRIPMIVRGPGFTGGTVPKEMVNLLDTTATVLEAAGVPVPTSVQGQPLQKLLQGAAADWPEDVFLQISESQTGRALRTQRWKYSVRAPAEDAAEYPASDLYVEDFLYDLQADPHELHNLIRDPDHAAVRQELAERLKARMRQAGEAEPSIHPKMS